jgi:hypothetical protein
MTKLAPLPVPEAARVSAFLLRSMAEQLAATSWEMEPADFDAHLANLLDTIEDKGALLAAYMRVQQDRVLAMEAEAAPFLAAAAKARAQVETTKTKAFALLEAVEACGEEPKLKGVGWQMWIQGSGGKAKMEVVDPLAVPAEFYTQPPTPPTPPAYVDQAKVEAALARKETVPGVVILPRGRHVVIK